MSGKNTMPTFLLAKGALPSSSPTIEDIDTSPTTSQTLPTTDATATSTNPKQAQSTNNHQDVPSNPSNPNNIPQTQNPFTTPPNNKTNPARPPQAQPIPYPAYPQPPQKKQTFTGITVNPHVPLTPPATSHSILENTMPAVFRQFKTPLRAAASAPDVAGSGSPTSGRSEYGNVGVSMIGGRRRMVKRDGSKDLMGLEEEVAKGNGPIEKEVVAGMHVQGDSSVAAASDELGPGQGSNGNVGNEDDPAQYAKNNDNGARPVMERKYRSGFEDMYSDQYGQLAGQQPSGQQQQAQQQVQTQHNVQQPNVSQQYHHQQNVQQSSYQQEPNQQQNDRYANRQAAQSQLQQPGGYQVDPTHVRQQYRESNHPAQTIQQHRAVSTQANFDQGRFEQISV